MQAGKKFGMQTMNDALYQAYVQRLVTKDECLRAAPDKNEFLRMIGEKPIEEQAIQQVETRQAAGSRR
jgi:twitching motility protein PilT